jgi:hypothetical protein
VPTVDMHTRQMTNHHETHAATLERHEMRFYADGTHSHHVPEKGCEGARRPVVTSRPTWPSAPSGRRMQRCSRGASCDCSTITNRRPPHACVCSGSRFEFDLQWLDNFLALGVCEASESRAEPSCCWGQPCSGRDCMHERETMQTVEFENVTKFADELMCVAGCKVSSCENLSLQAASARRLHQCVHASACTG